MNVNEVTQTPFSFLWAFRSAHSLLKKEQAQSFIFFILSFELVNEMERFEWKEIPWSMLRKVIEFLLSNANKFKIKNQTNKRATTTKKYNIIDRIPCVLLFTRFTCNKKRFEWRKKYERRNVKNEPDPNSRNFRFRWFVWNSVHLKLTVANKSLNYVNGICFDIKFPIENGLYAIA